MKHSPLVMSHALVDIEWNRITNQPTRRMVACFLFAVAACSFQLFMRFCNRISDHLVVYLPTVSLLNVFIAKLTKHHKSSLIHSKSKKNQQQNKTLYYFFQAICEFYQIYLNIKSNN